MYNQIEINHCVYPYSLNDRPISVVLKMYVCIFTYNVPCMFVLTIHALIGNIVIVKKGLGSAARVSYVVQLI